MPNAFYRIIDEPAPSALSRFVVNPLWIVLASMFVYWPYLPRLLWLWFLFNGLALRSPTIRFEIAWIVVGLGLSLALGEVPRWAFEAGLLSGPMLRWLLPYWFTLEIVVVIAVSYRLYLYQIGLYHLFRYLQDK